MLPVPACELVPSSPPTLNCSQGAVPVLSVVVPVYNSETTLPELVERVHQVLTGYVAAHEIILVNDGSRDGSWSVIEALARQDATVHGID
jgi:glycosyltransferase involved in cell wall biosynthesis